MSIIRNRELSQFGSFLYIDNSTQNIGIATNSLPFVGIGTVNPTSKLTVNGDVTANSFYGTFLGTVEASNYSSVSGVATNAISADYAIISGLSTLASGIVSTSSINTSGIITASSFYVDNTPLVDPILQTWFVGVGNSIYRLNGNIGIGTSRPSEKLSVSGNITATENISASRFISTITSGTSPLTISSNTLVTNLNADLLRGKILGGTATGDVVSIDASQTLANKTLSSPSLTTPTIGSGGANFSGSTSGTTNLRASATASGTLTLPAATDTLVAKNTTDTLTNKTIAAGSNTISGLTNSNLSGTAGITNANLANSTISGVSLGSNLNSLTVGSYLSLNSGTTYNGSAARTISVNASSTNDDPVNFPIVARNASGDFTAGTINCSYLNATFTVEAADFNSTSDIKLKENIQTVENALETVNALRGVSFDWKETGGSSYGVIAQELEVILPQLVKEGEIKSVNYNGLIGILIEAVKELSEEVKELKKKVL
jgi:hypothetical protein